MDAIRGQPGPDADDYIRDPEYRAGAYLKKNSKREDQAPKPKIQ